ncbi:transporter substrate-binding domain-containing protein [Methylobacterium aquaticum]|uniref:transporter substrate-binding domain-containing protein n=1 Tax=Methylobacterium aquaticum TaxID=270351 RepID=UPI001931F6D2|nr:transporter substrate-binding domain-containing protein [Methylobacterium aquaticum]QRE76561.1 transporter substrate-binding domain-containing protein [Methylobacterium aquaticum]
MKKRHGLAGLVVALALAGPARAEGKQITWTASNSPPFMMTEGEERNTGIFDRIRRLLSERMTGYTHSTLVVPFPRILASLKSGEEWCFVGGVKTPEREGFAVFSRPVAMFNPLRIVVRAADRARFAALGELSLRDLLTDHRSLRTSVLRNRAIAPAVDALFRQHPPGQIHSEFGEAFRMLLNDRLDYLVEYSSSMIYFARQLGQPGAFVGLPFAEGPETVFAR